MIKKIAILCSIFLNLCIVRWEPVAIRMTWEAVGSQTFTFYTENSNVFAFFVCLLVAVCQVICLFTGRQLPRCSRSSRTKETKAHSGLSRWW